MLKHWPPLNALRGFEAAARLGSFHKAAEELHLTQSAISQQIRSLEGYLEQPLFFRNGRKVSLTDAGFDLLSTTQSLLQQLAAGSVASTSTASPTNWWSIPPRPSPATGWCRTWAISIAITHRWTSGY